MNKAYLYLIIFLSVVGGMVYAYLVPFTQHEIYKSVDNYITLIQDKKQESLQFVTTSQQYSKDVESIDFIIKNYTTFEFTNKNIKIIENTLSNAVVEVSLTKRTTVNGMIEAQPVKYKIQVVKALNVANEKKWIISSRDQM